MLIRDILTGKIYEVISMDAVSDVTETVAYNLPPATEIRLGGVMPDGQTIVVDEDGVIHANLNEIGGELGDLSGRVTANEADILALQAQVAELKTQIEALQNG